MSAHITTFEDENGNKLYPVTKLNAVLDENNVDVGTIISNIENKLRKLLPTYDTAGEPFRLDFNTVYSTHSVLKNSKHVYDANTIVSTYPEPFVMNADSTGVLSIEFDVDVAQADTITVSCYINSTLKDSFTQSVSQGVTHITRQVTFITTQSNNTVYLTVGTSADNPKTVRNIVYTLTANNALFLREAPDIVYRCWPVSTLVYITKQTKTAGYYKAIDLQNIDHSGAYALVANQGTVDDTVYPLIIIYCSAGSSSFNQLAYALHHMNSDTLDLYNTENALQKTVNLIYNSTYSPDFVDIRPYCDAPYTTQILLGYPQEPRARRLRTYNVVRSFNSVQNFSNASVPVQMVSSTDCIVKNGSASGANDYTVYQDATGMWYINTFARLASNRAGLALGFGTRADLALCPPLAQDAVNDFAYLRAFICAYGTWYAYYIAFDKMNTVFTLQKTEIIPGDFDQILAGNGNVYFGVKDGGFTTFYDSFYKSIAEF